MVYLLLTCVLTSKSVLEIRYIGQARLPVCRGSILGEDPDGGTSVCFVSKYNTSHPHADKFIAPDKAWIFECIASHYGNGDWPTSDAGPQSHD
jgi:hypothetical protein